MTHLTFIASKTVGAGELGRGDNRGFNGNNESLTARVLIVATISTDTEKVYANWTTTIRPSEVRLETNLTENGRIDLPGDSVTVNASGNEANPLIGGYTGSPGITYSFSITVQSPGEDGTVKVTVSGQHDGFPAYEIIVQRPDSGNVSQTVYLHDPNKTGDGPQSLYGSGEYYIKDRETDIPSGRRPRR